MESPGDNHHQSSRGVGGLSFASPATTAGDGTDSVMASSSLTSGSRRSHFGMLKPTAQTTPSSSASLDGPEKFDGVGPFLKRIAELGMQVEAAKLDASELAAELMHERGRWAEALSRERAARCADDGLIRELRASLHGSQAQVADLIARMSSLTERTIRAENAASDVGEENRVLYERWKAGAFPESSGAITSNRLEDDPANDPGSESASESASDSGSDSEDDGPSRTMPPSGISEGDHALSNGDTSSHRPATSNEENSAVDAVVAATPATLLVGSNVTSATAEKEFLPRAVLLERLTLLEDELTRRVRREELLMFQQAKLKKRNNELRHTNTILSGEIGVIKEELCLLLERNRAEMQSRRRDAITSVSAESARAQAENISSQNPVATTERAPRDSALPSTTD